jgi:hypothetical protein
LSFLSFSEYTSRIEVKFCDVEVHESNITSLRIEGGGAHVRLDTAQNRVAIPKLNLTQFDLLDHFDVLRVSDIAALGGRERV